MDTILRILPGESYNSIHALADCGMRSVYRINKKANSMIFQIIFKSRPKLFIVVLEDHGNNIVQEKDNNANRVDEMASMLRNIIVS